ncbi:MAG TPA: class I SAM-dependent methyltransferase [Spirochaetota bacterium]|nr:class I SAM-dependent methyltransferase [Spirochaetota bacterium]HPW52384.1 class I SAM-dependent methyltransferase [Spirochaetota bacterium]HPY03678.1 class I SAM-dependent methyltransferase [Spirochaetota bacterium]HQA52935.1 class I SAM-dependent methyltransferase [Spirochaetota bacterium]HQO22339.1 class I SAM-dependent methyltransferase [Spirochaetota bacterium]
MKNIIFGNSMDVMPSVFFRMMAVLFKIRDVVMPHDYKLDLMGIKEGDVVLDCGCGTGSCLKKASKLTGERGLVYAVDVHPLAVKCAHKISERSVYKNIKPVLSQNGVVPVKPNSVDVIYALDMFHMVSDYKSFLRELYVLIKPDGKLYLEDGHQSRRKTIDKVKESSLWDIAEDSSKWIMCFARKK